MTEKLELYKCAICGNIVQIINAGVGELVCCGEKMEKLDPKIDNNSPLGEKHTPVIDKIEDKTFVTLKSHPMEENHYIQFIEVYPKDKSELYIKFLNPKELAQAELSNIEGNIETQSYCNIHGLWKNNNNQN
jgi:superoxide reductase